jgi:hypothetical protein
MMQKLGLRSNHKLSNNKGIEDIDHSFQEFEPLVENNYDRGYKSQKIKKSDGKNSKMYNHKSKNKSHIVKSKGHVQPKVVQETHLQNDIQAFEADRDIIRVTGQLNMIEYRIDRM